MKQAYNPVFYWANALQFGLLMAESQAVVTLRLLGMAGYWPVTTTEDSRMVSEKIQAATASVTQANLSLLAGKPPDQVMAAALKPYRQRTRANSKRLLKRGLTRPAR